jgi:CpeT/CpcT family (DUF1001)
LQGALLFNGDGMKNVIVSLVVTLLTCTAEAQKNKPARTSLQADMQEMLAMFEGEFDNFQQVYKEREDKVAEVHEHIHSIFKRVKLPAFGDHVFYVIQYMDGDTAKVYRQRIYTFTEDKAEQAIRLDIYSFAVDSIYYYANQHPEKLHGLTPQQMTNTAGCAVYWKKTDTRFWGYMKEKACSFVSRRSGKTIYITDSLLLTKDELWIRDEAQDAEGNYVFGHKGKIHHKLKRCHFYTGWILLQKAGFDNEYIQYRNQTWHDQGKRVRLISEDGKATKYEVELAAVVYGKDLEVLKIAIYEVGVSKAIAYAWATPGAKNIGINMRWIQAGLKLVQ